MLFHQKFVVIFLLQLCSCQAAFAQELERDGSFRSIAALKPEPLKIPQRDVSPQDLKELELEWEPDLYDDETLKEAKYLIERAGNRTKNDDTFSGEQLEERNLTLGGESEKVAVNPKGPGWRLAPQIPQGSTVTLPAGLVHQLGDGVKSQLASEPSGGSSGGSDGGGVSGSQKDSSESRSKIEQLKALLEKVRNEKSDKDQTENFQTFSSTAERLILEEQLSGNFRSIPDNGIVYFEPDLNTSHRLLEHFFPDQTASGEIKQINILPNDACPQLVRLMVKNRYENIPKEGVPDEVCLNILTYGNHDIAIRVRKTATMLAAVPALISFFNAELESLSPGQYRIYLIREKEGHASVCWLGCELPDSCRLIVLNSRNSFGVTPEDAELLDQLWSEYKEALKSFKQLPVENPKELLRSNQHAQYLQMLNLASAQMEKNKKLIGLIKQLDQNMKVTSRESHAVVIALMTAAKMRQVSQLSIDFLPGTRQADHAHCLNYAFRDIKALLAFPPLAGNDWLAEPVSYRVPFNLWSRTMYDMMRRYPTKVEQASGLIMPDLEQVIDALKTAGLVTARAFRFYDQMVPGWLLPEVDEDPLAHLAGTGVGRRRFISDLGLFSDSNDFIFRELQKFPDDLLAMSQISAEVIKLMSHFSDSNKQKITDELRQNWGLLKIGSNTRIITFKPYLVYMEDLILMLEALLKK